MNWLSGIGRMATIKAVTLAMLAAAPDVVLVTPHGKAYHTHKCMALLRSKEIKTMTEAAAKAAGLNACKICLRKKKADK